MQTRTLNSILALSFAAMFLVAIGCEDAPSPVAPENEEVEESPTSYPEIPRPSSPDETIPDESEVYTLLSGIAGKDLDFAPVWSDGRFTWNVDIQTQYEDWFGNTGGLEPGDYWNGTRRSESMTFEGGIVDLRDPTPFGTSWGDPHPRRILFVENGEMLATPRNPDKGDVLFQFQNYYPERRFTGALFGGYVTLDVDPTFGHSKEWRAYYVAAMSCGQLTNPVFVRRERLWKRLPLLADGSNLKSVRVDPGAEFAVTYTRTQGTSFTSSYTFTRTINGEIAIQAPKEVVGAKLGGSLSEAFGTQTTITEETSVEVQRTFSGIDGKTVIYSVWTSVERYSFVDEKGNPYEDPNFTFDDLGNAEIVGEYEWISSTAFDL
jgi:hypothetical protein